MSDTLDGVPALSEVRYEDLGVGDRFGPFEEPVRSPVSDRLRGPVGEHRSGSLAPPGVLILVTLRALRRALAGIPPGGVLLRQRLNVHEALPAKCDVVVDVRVSAQERRERGGLLTTFSFALTHQGSVAAVVDWTILAPGRASV